MKYDPGSLVEARDECIPKLIRCQNTNTIPHAFVILTYVILQLWKVIMVAAVTFFSPAITQHLFLHCVAAKVESGSTFLPDDPPLF